MHEENYWQAVLGRDHTYDGTFVFAVRSTGNYNEERLKWANLNAF